MKLLSYLIIVFAISGCSGTYQTLNRTIKLATADRNVTAPSVAETSSLAVDIVLYEQGGFPSATLGLALLEDGVYTWASNDGLIVQTQHGAIFRTVGYYNDLTYVKTRLNPRAKMNVTNVFDLSLTSFNVAVKQDFIRQYDDTFIHEGHSVEAYVIEYRVQFASTPHFYNSDYEWVNHYWYDKQTDLPLKSVQQFHPNGRAITMTYLSRIGRIVSGESL